MENKKLLLFDLDGTLLRDDKTISERTIRALRECRKRGMLIGVSTSRSEQNTLSFVEELKPDILITSGGALVKYQGEYIYRSGFSIEDTRRMIAAAGKVCGADCEITVDTIDAHYWNYKIDPKKQDKSWGDSIYTDFKDFRESALKICIEIFEENQAKQLQELFPECDCVRFSDGYWYKFTPREATKERAVMEVCAACGISTEEITAFGDDYADIGMLQLCGKGIAMGNAIDPVKQKADLVIGSNEEDGIAEYLERYFSLQDATVPQIHEICKVCLGEYPKTIERCGVGQGNYVYIVEYEKDKFVVRCSQENDAYKDTVYWLKQLASLNLPVPDVVAQGKYEAYEYLILTFLDGKDIGLVYTKLKAEEKKAIAKEIVQFQNRVATLKLPPKKPDWSWPAHIRYMLERAKERMARNGYFAVEKAVRLQEQMAQLEEYFSCVKPIAYLDDISSKNLLICKGRISGIIDIDWIGIGDKLTFAALTKMALLNLEYDTDYAEYLLEEMSVSDVEKRAFLFYTLMYCVDFMGERGMQFTDKTVEVSEQVINRLNRIYDKLWMEYIGTYTCKTCLGGSK